MLSNQELEAIKLHSQWDDENEEWAIPLFDFNDGNEPPQESRKKERTSFKVSNRNSAAVSPQPEDSGRDRNFRVKNSDTNRNSSNQFRTSGMNKFNHGDDIFDGNT